MKCDFYLLGREGWCGIRFKHTHTHTHTQLCGDKFQPISWNPWFNPKRQRTSDLVERGIRMWT